jgi:hypothetical protein
MAIEAPPSGIIVVSGLPRSGTSMMMRMLVAAGLPALTDRARAPNEDNPLGYFELEAVKRTRADPSWLDGAHGHAVKVVHVLLPDLPAGHAYRVLMMRRDMSEVLASQATMLKRAGKTPGVAPGALKRVYESQLAAAERWMRQTPGVTWIDVNYGDVIGAPPRECARVAGFLGLDEGAVQRMAGAIDPALYRNRAGTKPEGDGQR